MKQLILAAALALATAGIARAEEQCSMPKEGTWSVMGGQGQFTLKVEGCGEVIIVEGLGDPNTGYVKTLTRISDGTYQFSKSVRGVPLSLEIAMEGEQNMMFQWSPMGMPRPAYPAAWAADPPPGTVPAICGCAAFNNRVRSQIKDAQDWISVYSDPAYRNRPGDLPDWVDWTQSKQETLIDLVEASCWSYGDAVQQIGRSGSAQSRCASDGSPNDAGSGTDGADPITLGDVAAAYTDCRTCEVQNLAEQSGCGGDLITRTIAAHEATHVQRCKAANVAYDAWNDPTQPEPPSYCSMVRDPVTNADMEIEAYEGEIAFLRSAYLELCKRPAPA